MDNNSTPFMTRVKNAWNAFRDPKTSGYIDYDIGAGYSTPYHRYQPSVTTEKSIVSPAYNRAAIDVSQLLMRHIRVDENGNFLDEIESGLNRCLKTSANIDQSSSAFIQDVVFSMFDEGAVAIVPVDTTQRPINNNTYDILTIRTGRIVTYYPRHVLLDVYNDQLGVRQNVVMPKSKVAIVYNPLYEVMNQPNSTVKRLINKLNLLDAIDNQSGSGKLDLIIQVPYMVKGETRQKQAQERLKRLEDQLKDSKHGIAYADGTEKVIQLNRPAENNLMEQIEYLTRMLYSQLGLSEGIFDGTASQEEWLNYYNRTIEPVASSISDELKRKFLSPTAISQGQSIQHYRNPFSMITATDLSELADKLTRNEILSSNEFRAIIGYRPSKDPGADELRNKNLNVPDEKLNKE